MILLLYTRIASSNVNPSIDAAVDVLSAVVLTLKGSERLSRDEGNESLERERRLPGRE